MQGSATLRCSALAVSILLVACGPRPAGGDTRPAVIPWISTAAGPEPTPTPTPTPTPLAMRYCQAADLSLRAGRTGAAAGTWYATFVFTNRSSTQCQLQGAPLLERLDSAGRPLTMSQTSLAGSDGSPVALVPGITDGGGEAPAVAGQAQLFVGFASVLCMARPSAALAFGLPNGGGHLTTAWPRGAYSGLDCGGGINVAPFADALPHSPAPEPPPDFTVKVIMPHSVAIGQTLKYQVRLTNVAGHDIAFTSCPAYSEGIKGPTAFLRARYVLNCQPVGFLRSGETVTFAMELPIPASPSFDGSSSPQPGLNPVWLVLDWPYLMSSGSGWVTLTAAVAGAPAAALKPARSGGIESGFRHYCRSPDRRYSGLDSSSLAKLSTAIEAAFPTGGKATARPSPMKAKMATIEPPNDGLAVIRKTMPTKSPMLRCSPSLSTGSLCRATRPGYTARLRPRQY